MYFSVAHLNSLRKEKGAVMKRCCVEAKTPELFSFKRGKKSS